MRNVMLLVGALGSASAMAGEQPCACFVPTLDEIARMEERVADLPEPIYRYARYYAGTLLPPVIFKGQPVVPRRIRAEYIPLNGGEASAIHILEPGKLPPLTAEACIANLDDPPDNDAFLLILRCNSPGAWKPSAADIATLESTLALPAGAAPLESYVRHYAGIVELGVRLIQGVFVARAGDGPAILVESEIELPFLAGTSCRTIDVRYNSETRFGSVYCGETGR